MFVVEDATGVAGVELAEVGIGACPAAAAIVAEGADFAMVEAVGADGPILICQTFHRLLQMPFLQ